MRGSRRGRRLPGLRPSDAARAGGSALHLEDLAAAVAKNSGRRGSHALHWALPRLRTGVDSRPESLLRLLLVAAKLPEPLVNDPTLVDDGRRTLHPDLKYERWRVVFEYEGDGHRTDKRQFRRDIERRELFEAAGWRVIRVVADDLHGRQAFVARVRRILRDREAYLAVLGARDPAPARRRARP